MAKQVRGRDYYRQRIKKERPDLYADILAGKLTVGAARKLAGMGGNRTELQVLKGAWKKAAPAEQKQFLKWLRAMIPTVATPPPAHSPSSATVAVFDSDGRLQPWSRRRIEEILIRRKMKSGDLSDELGISRSNQSVKTAASNGTRIKVAATAAAIEHWLASNADV